MSLAYIAILRKAAENFSFQSDISVDPQPAFVEGKYWVLQMLLYLSFPQGALMYTNTENRVFLLSLLCFHPALKVHAVEIASG